MILRHKQVVEFDPLNREHNEVFAHFIREGQWPEGMTYRFNVHEPFTSVISFVQNKIVRAWMWQLHLEVDKKEKEEVK